jgi:hypothetical protein
MNICTCYTPLVSYIGKDYPLLINLSHFVFARIFYLKLREPDRSDTSRSLRGPVIPYSLGNQPTFGLAQIALLSDDIVAKNKIAIYILI